MCNSSTSTDKTFSVSGSGAGQVRSHAISKLHTSRLKEREGQLEFSKDKDRILELKASNNSYTVEEEILNAEIIHSLKCVEPNYSFASTNGDGKVFEAMFPDSKIAKGYKQSPNTPFSMPPFHIKKIYYWRT